MERETKGRDMPRSLELHLLKMFFGIPFEKVKRFRNYTKEEELVRYKTRRSTVRSMLTSTIPAYEMDISMFKTELGGYWTDIDSVILSDREMLTEVLKENHELSADEIKELLDNYKSDEELASVPDDY